MKQGIYCYSYVEDVLSKAVVCKIVAYVNSLLIAKELSFRPGFPSVTGGNGRLRSIAQRFIPSAKAGLCVIIVTDLDTVPTPNELGKVWFNINCLSELPHAFIFRIAIREIESWIMADRVGFSTYMSFSMSNLPVQVDDIADPKGYLLNLIQRKCNKKWQKDMLPLKSQHIGLEYNPRLVRFIEESWNVENAMKSSESLFRSINRIVDYLS